MSTADNYEPHPLACADTDVFFRGLDSNLIASLRTGKLSLNSGKRRLFALELDTGVLYWSADLSDALAVARRP